LGFGAAERALTRGSGNISVFSFWATAVADTITIRTAQFNLICLLLPPDVTPRQAIVMPVVIANQIN
jgi:hypothetical protein